MAIIREAPLEFYEPIGRLSERERLQILQAFDELVPKIPARPARDVDRGLSELRKARRAGGRQTIS